MGMFKDDFYRKIPTKIFFYFLPICKVGLIQIKKEKMGLQPLFFNLFLKINPWVFAVFHK